MNDPEWKPRGVQVGTKLREKEFKSTAIEKVPEACRTVENALHGEVL
jgi:hypothetical protein